VGRKCGKKVHGYISLYQYVIIIIIIIIIIILAKNEYLMRHDKVCTHLHYSICKALGTETTDMW